MEHKKVSENGLVGDFYYRGDGKKHLAIILLGGAEGSKAWSESSGSAIIDKWVQLGYAVLSLAYFGAKGLPQTLEHIPLEYFETAMTWLAQHPSVIPNHYGVIGVSKGGELALLLASRYPEIKIVAGIVPSSVVFVGIQRGFGRPRSSWSYEGQGFPYVGISLSFALIKAIRTKKFVRLYTKALQNKQAVARATIQVESINGPILLLSGKDDQMWPSMHMSNEIVKRLERLDFKHKYEHIVCESDHNVLGEPNILEKINEFFCNNFKRI